MLGRGYQACKQGCNAFNHGEYEVAIGHFREARGYARNAFASEYKDKHYQASALLAECTTNIAHSLLLQISDVNPAELDWVLLQLDNVEKILKEAKAYLIDAKNQIALALPSLQANAFEDLKELEKTFTCVQLDAKKARINAYWQACHVALNSIDKSAAKIAKMEKCSAEILKEHHDKIHELISMLKKAMATAQSAKESEDINEIRDLIISLYEECGDFITNTGNPNLANMEREFTDFILKQYSEAFHLKRQKPGVTEPELLPLFMSILNVLETKANLEKDHQDKAPEKIIASCVELIRFHKKFMPKELENSLSKNHQVEVQSYLFTAHRLLAKLYIDPNMKKAHFERAMSIARTLNALAKETNLAVDAPLKADLKKAHFFYVKNQFKNAMNILKNRTKLTQNTVATIAAILGRIHRDGNKDASQKGLLIRLFDCNPNKIPPSLALSMELFLAAQKNTTDDNILKQSEENIKLLLTQYKQHFDYTYRTNKHYQQRPVIGISVSSLTKTQQEIEKEFDELISGYLSNIEVIFTQKNMSRALPGILREISRALLKDANNRHIARKIDEIAADIDAANTDIPEMAGTQAAIIPAAAMPIAQPTKRVAQIAKTDAQPATPVSQTTLPLPTVTKVAPRDPRLAVAAEPPLLLQFNTQQVRGRKRRIVEDNLPLKKRILLKSSLLK